MHILQDMVLHLDEAGRILASNLAAQQEYGYSAEEFRTLTLLDLRLPEEAATNLREHIAESVARDQVLETRNRRKDGSVFPVEVRVQAIACQGRTEYISIIRNVTLQHAAQRQLWESETKLKTLIHSMQDIIFTLDTNGCCNGVFGQAVAKLGLDEAVFQGKRLDEVFGEDYEVFYQHMLPQVLKGEHVLFDAAANIGLGLRYFQIAFSPLYSSQGDIYGVVGVGRDYTVRKLALEALRESEDRYRSLVETTPYGVILTDLSGQIQMANQQAARLHQLEDAEEMLGQSLFLMVTPRDRDKLRMAVQRAFETRRAQAVECWLKRGLEESFIGEIIISLVLDEKGQATAFINVERDITEQKMLEAALKQQNEELQDTLERLKTVQMKMIQQEKLAGIGQLAAGVAHEINNPLGFVISNFASLRNYLERLRSVLSEYQDLKLALKELPEKPCAAQLVHLEQLEKDKKLAFIMEDVEDLLNESNEGLERVKKIVSGLRTFARVDQEFELEEYDLNAGIHNTLLMARNEIKYWAEIEQDLGEVPAIEAVGSYINQVLLNMVVNAAHAIRMKNLEQPGLIRVVTYADDSNVYCQIADNGVGIAPQHRERIFEPFFTTKPVGQGTGLGLSISYDIIVNKHQGEIQVESVLGEGTLFTIRLPLRQRATADVELS